MSETAQIIENNLKVLKEADIPQMLGLVTFRSKEPGGPIFQHISILVDIQTGEIVKVDRKYMGDDQEGLKNIFIEIISDLKTWTMKEIKLMNGDELDDPIQKSLEQTLKEYVNQINKKD